MQAVPSRFRLVRVGPVASTNVEAEALARTGCADGTLVVATEQTAGRGRDGRVWQSPPGNFYSSLVLRPACPAAAAANLSFVTALALADAALVLLRGDGARSAGPPVTCKWPNDVLVDGAKIGGILLQSAATAEGGLDWVIIGTGVNVAVAPDPRQAAFPPAALRRWAVGCDVDAVLAAFTTALDRWLTVWERQGFSPLRDAWLNRCHHRGGRVTVRVGGAVFAGTFTDLDGDGALVLDGDDGVRRRITAGDVFPAAG